MEQKLRQLEERIRDLEREVARLPARVAPAGNTDTGACESQNAIIQITVFGSPTGGTFDLAWEIDSTSDTLTFDADSDSTAFTTEMESHPSVGSGNVTVTGGPLPDGTIQVEFTNDLAETDIELPLATWANLTGGSGVSVLSSYSQVGIE